MPQISPTMPNPGAGTQYVSDPDVVRAEDESVEDFDLIILGSGSGNSLLDHRHEHWRVAIVEEGSFGGTCLNRGCIPSKMLVFPADIIRQADAARDLGVSFDAPTVDWASIQRRIWGRIDPISEGGLAWRQKQPNVTVFTGLGRFVGERLVSVSTADGQRLIRGTQIVIAVGSRPASPSFPGTEHDGVHTSDTIMRIQSLPRSMTIIGSGFVACEQAHIFSAFGVRVTLISRGDTLLRTFDRDLSAAAAALFARRTDLHTNAEVLGVTRSPGGLTTTFQVAGNALNVESEIVLLATGRVANGDRLDVDKTGLELSDGLIPTDDFLRTPVTGIWALGDARNALQLKHTANQDARVIGHNIVSEGADYRPIEQKYCPVAVFTEPQMAAFGARSQDRPDALVGWCRYESLAYGWAMEDSEGFVKVLIDPDDRTILGAHIFGYQASLLIQPLVQAAVAGWTAEKLAREVLYPHPALTEAIENAALNVPQKSR